MRKLLFLLLSSCLSIAAHAQLTSVTALVQDTGGSKYVNCQYVVDFLPNPNQTIPYSYGGNINFTKQYSAQKCDSFGNLQIQLPDNLNGITPPDSQWRFSICSAHGYSPGDQFCFAVPITITGATQNISSALTAAAAILPLGYPFPLTTKGDLFGFGIAPARVPVGADGQCLVADSTQLTGLRYGSCGSGGGGGGGGLPDPGANGIVLRTALNTTAVVPNTSPGSVLVSGTSPSYQSKPLFDARDYGLAQNGSTDDSTALTSLLNTIGSNPATILFTGPVSLESTTFPPNVKVKFELNGKLKPISSSTPIGGAGFVQGSGASNVNTLTSSCSVTLNATVAGNTILFMENHFFTAAQIPFGAVTDSQGGHYSQAVQQGFNFSSVNSAWLHSNIAGGNITITVPYRDNLNNPVNVANGCIAWEISGMGPVVAAESSLASVENANSGTLTMSSGPITTTAGSLVIGFGGQSFLNQASCTPGGGFTQPAGTAGFISGGSQPVTGYGFNLCATYKLVSPGGAQTPSQVITNDPANPGLNKYWAYASFSLIPSSAVINIQGPIDAPSQQIFTNSLGGQGTIDLSGNVVLDKVFPEWWGASPLATASVNTPAMQAALIGAYGSNRVNGSQANVYNRELHFSGLYNINGTLNANHMNGFNWTCSQRFACGLNQTATNTSILTTTSGGTYGNIDNVGFSSTASQDINHPLVDLNYTATPGNDLVTQFIDWNRNVWNGNSVTAIGLRIAAAGGGAQGSNIISNNNLFENFTESGYMVGAGSNCVPSSLATNAIAITINNGDFQNNHAYGFENFGGGQIEFYGTTFEDGGFTTSQTGYDICGQTGAAGEYVVVQDVRSESKYFLSGGAYSVRNSYVLDQAFNLGPGSVPSTGLTIQGSGPGGDGVYYNVTTGGTWTGVGTQQIPVIATSGNATTLTNTNQSVTGANTIGTFVKLETVTQAVTGSTGTLLNVPISIGTVTGSVTSGTIGTTHIVTQATTGVTCTVGGPAPTGSGNLLVELCSGTADNSHIWTDGTTGGTYTPSTAPAFAPATPVMVITAATGSPDGTHNWTGGTSSAVLVPSGSPTNTANYTVNQWTGYQATIVGATGANQYCVITSNSATVLTCSAGWKTRFPAVVTTTNTLDNTSTYIVEPNWGTQTTNGSVIWAADNKPVGTINYADGFFLPGLKLTINTYSVLHGVQVTRSDWQNFAGFPVDGIWNFDGLDGVVAGVPSGNTTGAGAGTLGQITLVRNWGFTRNGITGISSPSQRFQGTMPITWASGLAGGGLATSDVAVNVDPNASAGTKKGRWYIENNSSGTAKFWYFNADGTFNGEANFPITDYGAFCDGSHDDTAAIQAAEAAAEATGKAAWVRFPAGQCNYSSTLTIQANFIHWVGQANDGTVLMDTTAGNDFLDITGPSFANPIAYGSIERIAFLRNVAFTGNPSGIKITNVSNWDIDHVDVWDSNNGYNCVGCQNDNIKQSRYIQSKSSTTTNAFFIQVGDSTFITDCVSVSVSGVITNAMNISNAAADLWVTRLNVALGGDVVITGTGGNPAGQDVHFISSILEPHSSGAAVQITGENGNQCGLSTPCQVTFIDTHIANQNGPAILCTNCQGVSFSQSDLRCPATGNCVSFTGASSANDRFNDNWMRTIFTGSNHPTFLDISAGVKSMTVTGNSFFGTSNAAFTTAIAVSASTLGALSGNTINGFGTNGITFDATSNNWNMCANTIDGTNITNQIVNSGAGNACGAGGGPAAFSGLASCSGINEGALAAVTDSNTAVWGANVAGGSTNHVLAYCDGTNWTVAGK